ncbi:MAG TPA: hypothetical protein VG413_05110 [Candidatus Dormibacteraeota bacterium]|jgi:hypothetical protein|nr:hypothetical protein [Candidatus Dormibacteraeota bacterium]
MTVTDWLKARGIELGASLCTAAVLIGGLAIGVPFLRERIPEVFLYSFCCVAAVLLRAVIDLAVRATILAVRGTRPAAAPAAVRLEPSGA